MIFFTFGVEGVLILAVILVLACLAGFFGSVELLMTWLLDHWYVVALVIGLRLLSEIVYIKILPFNPKNEKSIKNKHYAFAVFKNIAIALSFMSFCYFALQNHAAHPWLTGLFSLPYLGAIIGIAFSFIITMIALVEVRVSEKPSKYYDISDISVPWTIATIVSFMIFGLLYLWSLNFWNFVFLCCNCCLAYYSLLSCIDD